MTNAEIVARGGVVLNLVISGIPSIQFTKSYWLTSLQIVLNLVISGIPSILYKVLEN